jgi:non-specific serine/threonine protein kinase
MSKTNTKFINHYKNYNYNKNINKYKNICNKKNVKRKNKSKNNSSILYSKMINNNFSYSTNSKNSKSQSNKKNKKKNFNESLIKKGITGNNTKIMNKIAKKYNNMKKNFNKNNICIQKGKKITKKKINNIVNNNNKSVLLTKREKTSLVQSESINNNKTSNKYEDIDKKAKRKYKQNNLINNFDINKDNKKLDNNIINNLNENNNLSISIVPNENYYLEESKKLSEKIIQYGKEHKYKVYPKTNLSFYKIGRSIGRGAFGKVNLALHVLSGHIVAIKSFNKTNHNFPLNKIRYEIKIMQKLRNNKRIVKLLEAFENEKYFFIIMENIIGGNLLNAINKMTKLSESIARNIFKQLIETIKYIHNKGIVHRDIKPDNILLNINNNIKLCDFGVSKEIKKGQLITDSCGTPAFIAPEILLDEPYDPYMTDIWSSGVVLYVMVSGFFPFTGINESSLHRHILSGKFPKIQNISNNLADLLNKILELNPRKRINLDEILNHPWITNVEIGNIDEKNKFFNNNNNLFTKAEKIIYFKLRKDYRDINNIEEGNLETFTYRNIDTRYQEENLNELTVSFVHTPFNTIREKDYDDDLFYDDVNIEKDIMKFLPKANEMNMQYEINNNCDFDHGFIINKKDNYKKKIMSSFNESYLQKQKQIKNKKEEMKKKENEKEIEIKNNNLDIDNIEFDNKSYKENNTTKSNTFNFDNNAIKYVESFGYKREFIIKSLETNEINHATATYYLKLSLNYE